MRVRWILFGAPCAGSYDADSIWPPPDRLRVVTNDEGGSIAVLERNELPADGETVVEYERRSWGMTCSRPGVSQAFATYMRIGLAPRAQAREIARGLRHLEVAS